MPMIEYPCSCEMFADKAYLPSVIVHVNDSHIARGEMTEADLVDHLESYGL